HRDASHVGKPSESATVALLERRNQTAQSRTQHPPAELQPPVLIALSCVCIGSSFPGRHMTTFSSTRPDLSSPLRIAINGYGRIGRSVLRALYEQGLQSRVQVVAINEPSDLATMAYLSRFDSTHGVFPGSVEEGDDT